MSRGRSSSVRATAVRSGLEILYRCAWNASTRHAAGSTWGRLSGGFEGLRAKGGKRKVASGDVATNRQASYRYDLLERFECGIVLTGTEVKSLREGKAQLKDSYAVLRDGEVWLIGLYIPPYGPAARDNHEPE